MTTAKLQTRSKSSWINQFRKLWIWLTVATTLLLISAEWLAAQDYDSLPINPGFVIPPDLDDATREERTARRAEQRKVKTRITDAKKATSNIIKSNGANITGDADLYLREYRLAQMTQTDIETLSRLGQLRSSFVKDYLSSRIGATTRRAVIQKTLPILNQLANGDAYHPAVRINAVTLIGLLDLEAGTTGSPPNPSPEAYQSLKRIFQTAKEDYLKIAALSGIRRFAEVTRRRNQAVVGSDIKGQFTSIVKGKAQGQKEWNDDMDYWLKRRSTQILGFIGEGNDVITASKDVMNAKDIAVERDDFWLRFDGLEAISHLKFNALDKRQIDPLIDEVLAFAAYAMKRESKWITEQLDDLV
ncbi:MAG: hypothetical protein AAGA30_03235, partial [Planctomycetota bacterium]